MGRTLIQKEIVYDTLKSMNTHPTVKELYDAVKKVDSSIGQATVYRNVNKLYETGFIRKISTGTDIDRYDADLSNHYHLICKKCGKMIDIFDNTIYEYIRLISKNQNIEIDSYELILKGICSECGGSIEEV